MLRPTLIAAVFPLLASAALGASAQGLPAVPVADTGGVGVHVIGLVTEARPALDGASLRELYLTQPMVVLDDPGPRFSGRLMLNFEAWTLEDGELNAGTFGEGFVDRRHPHTFLHEVVVTAHDSVGGISYSLTGGRGFVPFGSDDPMARPFVKYPTNHHLAQILERWLIVGAARAGPLALEFGAFNGDEPAGPRSTGRKDRFADSYAGRVTFWPDILELEVSHARVESPEHADGGGLDHRKWHASGRTSSVLGLPVYALLEWARTDQYDEATRVFTFQSWLAEGALDLRAARLALRWERTTRPEEERLEDRFRSARPPADDNIIGVTRWTSSTLQVAREVARGDLTFVPFVEMSRLGVHQTEGVVFDPPAFYGDEVQWSFSLGLRVAAGIRHARAGRYGVALADAHAGMR
jgi:hypothetical protein